MQVIAIKVKLVLLKNLDQIYSFGGYSKLD